MHNVCVCLCLRLCFCECLCVCSWCVLLLLIAHATGLQPPPFSPYLGSLKAVKDRESNLTVSCQCLTQQARYCYRGSIPAPPPRNACYWVRVLRLSHIYFLCFPFDFYWISECLSHEYSTMAHTSEFLFVCLFVSEACVLLAPVVPLLGAYRIWMLFCLFEIVMFSVE